MRLRSLLICLLVGPFAGAAQAEDGDAAYLEGIQPQITLAPDGAVYVTLIHEKNVVVVSSTDGAKTFGAPVIALDAKGRAAGGRRRGPRIGSDAKGNLVVTAPLCFDEAELTSRYPKSDLWLTRSEDQGATWSPPIRVNEVPKKASESLHWMAVARNGDAHVAWLDHRDGRGNKLWYARVRGKKVGKNKLLTGLVCECCAPGLGVNGKGNPYVVVRERSDSDRAILLMVSRNGGRSFKPPQAVNARPTGVDT